jgi:hypothetical protein
VIIVDRFMGICRVLSRRKHATFDDNNVRFVLDQHAEVAFLFVVLHALVIFCRMNQETTRS